jgi:hypothetical protein
MPGWEKCEAGRGRGGLARIHCKAGAWKKVTYNNYTVNPAGEKKWGRR